MLLILIRRKLKWTCVDKSKAYTSDLNIYDMHALNNLIKCFIHDLIIHFSNLKFLRLEK